jgi:hypothetical protein
MGESALTYRIVSAKEYKNNDRLRKWAYYKHQCYSLFKQKSPSGTKVIRSYVTGEQIINIVSKY